MCGVPSKSKAQANLMRAAQHGASFPMAVKVRASMAPGKLSDFASTPNKGLPRRAKKR